MGEFAGTNACVRVELECHQKSLAFSPLHLPAPSKVIAQSEAFFFSALTYPLATPNIWTLVVDGSGHIVAATLSPQHRPCKGIQTVIDR